jgi:hypothetical protein
MGNSKEELKDCVQDFHRARILILELEAEVEDLTLRLESQKEINRKIRLSNYGSELAYLSIKKVLKEAEKSLTGPILMDEESCSIREDLIQNIRGILLIF